jgi:hypothetical protein
MPLQNRVTPFGTIERDPARGLLMGNRGGRLHDPVTCTLTRRRWASKHWIICVTEFRQRHRQVMSAGTYTELFFLDEVTALAAGHRPCYECQRQRALQFAHAFATAKGKESVRAGEMDTCLHKERLADDNSHILPAEEVAILPDGSMVAAGPSCFAVMGEKLLPWSFGGYGTGVSVKKFSDASFLQLTPPSTVEAIKAGYQPRFHPTAKP